MTGPGTIQLVRSLLRAVLRITGSTCVVLSIALGAMSWGPYSKAQASATAGLGLTPAIGVFFSSSVLVGAAGVWLLLLDAMLLRRWLVPATAKGCLECGYELRGLRGKVCPECGATVGDNAGAPVSGA